LGSMPFEAAVALSRVGWHEAWRASLKRAERAGSLDAGKPDGKKAVAEKDAQWHKTRAAKAAESWNLLAPKWLDQPRGAKDGAEVTKALLDCAKAAAEHTAARRVGFISLMGDPAKKAEKAADEEALQAWQRWEAAQSTLKEHRSVLRESLADVASNLLWASGWHAANSVAEAEVKVMEGKEEDEEQMQEFDDGDEEGEGDDDEAEGDDDDEDEEEKFGADYMGSSDDAVEDHVAILSALPSLFWDDLVPWQGTRLHLFEDAAAAVAAVEAISRVPTFSGPFPRGLNAIRLVLREALCTPKDPLGDMARAALSRAEAVGLRVMLEVPAKVGAKGEEWLRKVAQETADLKCVRAVALPQAVVDFDGLKGLLAAVRTGGLTQGRCQIVLLAPCPEDETGEDFDGWSAEFRAMHSTDVASASQNVLLQDGNVLLERPAYIPSKEEGGPEDAQGLLDAASHAGDSAQDMGLVGSWNLAVPKGVKFKSKDGPSLDWYREFGQRLLGSVQSAESGWFFDAWERPLDAGGEGPAAQFGLKAALEAGWLDFAAQDQVLAPTGAKHTHSLIYLHGFMCDGYSYLCEPEYFYKMKKRVKKKKSSKSKTKDDDAAEDEEEDYEPHPGLKVVCPSAPCRKITCQNGREQPSWHDYLTDLDGEGEDDLPREELEEVAKRIHELLDREVAAVGAKNVFLGGASQGCAVALHCALTYPGGGLGGLLGTMGHLLSFTEIKPEWVESKTPVFVYHGLADSTMPWEKWVGPSYQRLKDAGVDVRITTEEGVDHADGNREQVWTRSFLTEVLRPASVKTVAKKADAKKGAKKK